MSSSSQIDKLWYIQTMEYYSALRQKKKKKSYQVLKEFNA